MFIPYLFYSYLIILCQIVICSVSFGNLLNILWTDRGWLLYASKASKSYVITNVITLLSTSEVSITKFVLNHLSIYHFLYWEAQPIHGWKTKITHRGLTPGPVSSITFYKTFLKLPIKQLIYKNKKNIVYYL